MVARMTTTRFASVPRVSPVAGRLRVPGDKSISHRDAMLAAIAEGASRLSGSAPGADCHAEGRTTVTEPTPTRDHTERALEAFGGRVIRDGDSVGVDGGQRLRAITADVPGDVAVSYPGFFAELERIAAGAAA